MCFIKMKVYNYFPLQTGNDTFLTQEFSINTQQRIIFSLSVGEISLMMTCYKIFVCCYIHFTVQTRHVTTQCVCLFVRLSVSTTCPCACKQPKCQHNREPQYIERPLIQRFTCGFLCWPDLGSQCLAMTWLEWHRFCPLIYFSKGYRATRILCKVHKQPSKHN